MKLSRKSVAWIKSEVKTPPISQHAREQIGRLIRRLQRGLSVEMPHSRPMPSIGRHCHELRINDGAAAWRVIYRIDEDAIIVVHVFSKKTQATPQNVIKLSQKRLAEYDAIIEGRNHHE